MNPGYPFFYGNEDLDQDIDQDEKFLLFSLDPIVENAELTLAQAVTFPLFVDPVELLGDEFTFKFCDQISQVCGSVHFVAETDTLIMDYSGFCKLVSNSDIIIQNLSSDLLITTESARQQTANFFSEKNILVQAEGVQGTLYKAGSYIQSAGSAGIVVNTIGLAKLAGVSGLQILKAQPSLAVAIPTTGAMFFYGCGAILGDNVVGKVFVSTGDVCAIPIKCVEIMWNSYGNPVIQKVFGIPVILNMTKTLKVGPGYSVEEIARYVTFNKKSFIKAMKEKMISWLS